MINNKEQLTMYKISSKSQVVRIKLLVKLFVLIFTVHCSLFTIHCFSQGLGINISGSPANSKSLLDVDATGMSPKAGILIPRINTNERNAISAPIPESLLIYNIDSHCFEAYYNGSWVAFGCLGSGCQIPATPIAGTITPSETDIVWNWNSVSGATGYKWNTVSNYASATDNGASNSYTQVSLTCNTAYTLYVWAYNSCGNSTATTLTQTTSACGVYVCGQDGTFVDARDGQTYGYVDIGTQRWMCQNLNIGTKINGSSNQTNNSIIEKYCYNDVVSNCNIYGGFYQWDEMMQYHPSDNGTTGTTQGLCPSGWHIPTDAEWTALTTSLGGESVAGGKMKTTGTIEAGTGLWYSPNTDATNESRFTVLPGGYRFYSDGKFGGLGYYANFWSSTDSDATYAWSRYLNYNDANVGRYKWSFKTYGLSCRCVKD